MKKMTIIILLICIIMPTLTGACTTRQTLDVRGKDSGNTVFYGGLIYRKTGMPPVEAVAVKNGKFRYAGSLNGALKVAGRDCELVDLQGKMMMPSFFDAHAHPNLSSLLELRDLPYEGDIPKPKEYAAHIKKYLQAHPNTQVLRGTGWDNAAFTEGPPNKALLDQVSMEIPIFIRSSDQHSAWVNSKALEVSKAEQYIDSYSGLIVLDQTGKPCGTLRDDATILVDSALPPITVAEHKELILKFQDMAHSLGITGYMCAMVLPRDNQYTAYRELLAEGKLLTYTQLAFLVTPQTYKDAIEWTANEIKAYEDGSPSILLGFRLAKFFMDGAIVGQTAYLSEDYASRPGYRGEPIWPSDAIALREAFKLCEKNNLRIHIHVIGDAAVKLALDGLETLEKPNRHALTHLELVDPNDISRLHNLGIVAVINPYWFCKSAVWEDSELKQLGRYRAEHMLPAKSFYDTGMKVAAASDYPVTGTPNPLIGIEMAATRTLIAPWRGGRTAEECTENPNEAISTEQAIDAFTLTAAYAYDLEKITGSIEAGKSADFILLDKNILQTKAPSEAKVLETWFRGSQVYKAKQQTPAK